MDRHKFPRTPHFSWSPGFTGDDIRLADTSRFENMREVVMTEKLDGENTTLYSDGYIHARSIDSNNHPSRAWVKKALSAVAHDLPEGWRLCGENLYAVHSISYTELPTFFFVFSIFTEDNLCLSWEDTEEMAELLELKTVPVLYRGPWDEETIKQAFNPKSSFGEKAEGYVVRNADSFPYSAYGKNVAKYVRANHVQTDDHWTANWKPANLKKDS